mmetsp:Transcript_31747/g.100891  ORF Transcript_31747/g.100891 Transcript_31747/m.100891 type:complete len:103 (+) Transcript_31747:501-809(+)
MPHLAQVCARAAVLVLCWAVGGGLNNALCYSAAADRETAVAVVAKAGLDMTNAHLVLVLLTKGALLHVAVDPAELGFDCFGAATMLLLWRMWYAERFGGWYS